LKSDCFDPELMTMLSALTGRPPDRIESCRAIAVRSSGTPLLGGYRVIPFWIAWIPACDTAGGVSKSGSPTLRS
jgi:hypothetical protein